MTRSRVSCTTRYYSMPQSAVPVAPCKEVRHRRNDNIRVGRRSLRERPPRSHGPQQPRSARLHSDSPRRRTYRRRDVHRQRAHLDQTGQPCADPKRGGFVHSPVQRHVIHRDHGRPLFLLRQRGLDAHPWHLWANAVHGQLPFFSASFMPADRRCPKRPPLETNKGPVSFPAPSSAPAPASATHSGRSRSQEIARKISIENDLVYACHRCGAHPAKWGTAAAGSMPA